MRLRRKSKHKTKEPAQKRRNGKDHSSRLPLWAREGIGIALLGVALFLCLSVFSYSPETDPGFFQQISPRPRDVKNLGGPIGSYTASLLKEILGLAAYFVGALVAVLALFVIAGRRVRITLWKGPLGLVFLVSLSSLFSLLLPHRPNPGQGGIVGYHVATSLLGSLHPAGTYLVLILVLVLTMICLCEVTILKILGRLFSRLLALLRSAGKATANALRAAGKGTANAFLAAARGLGLLLQGLGRRFQAAVPALGRAARAVTGRIAGSRFFKKSPAPGPNSHQAWEENFHTLEIGASQTQETQEPRVETHRPEAAISGPEMQIAEPSRHVAEPDKAIAGPETEPHAEEPSQAIKITPLQRDPHAPEEPDASEQKPKPARKPRQAILPFLTPLPKGYRPPPLELLDNPAPSRTDVIDRQLLLDAAKALEQKLKDFGIDGKVTEIHPGPIITLFEYEPAPGIKVNRIVNLADDLALAMKVMSVRIVAPIPGKAVVGIEVPNSERQMVHLKDVLASDEFQKTSAKLPLALGKDIAGRPFTTDLSRMPHLLIAGATGTGKSVCPTR